MPAIGRREVIGGAVAIAMIGWPVSAIAMGRPLIAGFETSAQTRPINGVRTI